MLHPSQRFQFLVENVSVLLISLEEAFQLVLDFLTELAGNSALERDQSVRQSLDDVVLTKTATNALGSQNCIDDFYHGVVGREVHLQVTVCIAEHEAGAEVSSLGVCALGARGIVRLQIERLQVLLNNLNAFLGAADDKLLTEDGHLERLETILAVFEKNFAKVLSLQRRGAFPHLKDYSLRQSMVETN